MCREAATPPLLQHWLVVLAPWRARGDYDFWRSSGEAGFLRVG
jgi:hypothetical protein